MVEPRDPWFETHQPLRERAGRPTEAHTRLAGHIHAQRAPRSPAVGGAIARAGDSPGAGPRGGSVGGGRVGRRAWSRIMATRFSSCQGSMAAPPVSIRPSRNDSYLRSARPAYMRVLCWLGGGLWGGGGVPLDVLVARWPEGIAIRAGISGHHWPKLDPRTPQRLRERMAHDIHSCWTQLAESRRHRIMPGIRKTQLCVCDMPSWPGACGRMGTGA